VTRPAILQIIPSLHAGGAERTTIDIAHALVAEGYAAIVASEGGRMEYELLQAGAELIRFPAATKNPLTIWQNAETLADIIRERNVVLVHARSRAPAWSAFIAARRTRIPFVTTYHGIYSGKGRLKRAYNSVMAKGDAVIANSQWTANHVLKTYPAAQARLAVIPRGLDLSYFDPAQVTPARVASLWRIWQLTGRERIVLLPGRLSRWKGQLVFIEALALLKASGRWPEDARAVIAGDTQGRSEYGSELAHAIQEADVDGIVTLTGHINDMAAAYVASSIVISASTDPEAFGRVPPEAAAMGRPVIATDHGGTRETVLVGESGLLTPPGDAVALAGSIADLLGRTPEQLAEMGARGQTHVAERFTVERMCADTLALYRKLIGT